jgi:hypothetical protein
MTQNKVENKKKKRFEDQLEDELEGLNSRSRSKINNEYVNTSIKSIKSKSKSISEKYDFDEESNVDDSQTNNKKSISKRSNSSIIKSRNSIRNDKKSDSIKISENIYDDINESNKDINRTITNNTITKQEEKLIDNKVYDSTIENKYYDEFDIDKSKSKSKSDVNQSEYNYDEFDDISAVNKTDNIINNLTKSYINVTPSKSNTNTNLVLAESKSKQNMNIKTKGFENISERNDNSDNSSLKVTKRTNKNKVKEKEENNKNQIYKQINENPQLDIGTSVNYITKTKVKNDFQLDNQKEIIQIDSFSQTSPSSYLILKKTQNEEIEIRQTQRISINEITILKLETALTEERKRKEILSLQNEKMKEQIEENDLKIRQIKKLEFEKKDLQKKFYEMEIEKNDLKAELNMTISNYEVKMKKLN